MKVGPLWHQWLRYTRRDPPTMEEQRGDVVRQARMKQLAAEADARWEAKPRVMEDPLPGQALPAQPVKDTPTTEETKTNTTEADKSAEMKTTPLRAESRRRRSLQRDDAAESGYAEEVDPKDPWKQARTRGPSEDWQPQAWTPNAKK